MTLVLQEQKVTTFWQKKLLKSGGENLMSAKKIGTWKRFKYADSKKHQIVDEEDVEQVKKKGFEIVENKEKRRNEKGTYFANR